MRHSSLLVPMIDKLLKKARVKLSAIDCFAISIGPGSFTGLRIGVATVKGFAYVMRKPIVTVPTLDSIAENAKIFKGIICPVLDARKNKVYACLYRSDGSNVKKISKYLLISAEDLIKRTAGYDKVFFSDDALRLIGKTDDKKIDWHPRAEVVARLGSERYKRKKFVNAKDLEPMYLYSRECDIKGI